VPTEHRLYMAERTMKVLEFIEAYGAYYQQEDYETASSLLVQSQRLNGNYHLVVMGALDMGLMPNPIDHPIAFHNHMQRMKRYITILKDPDLEPDELIAATEKVYLEPATTEKDATSGANSAPVDNGISGQ
jgi:hypothetical protein